jgi:chromosome segregation ATPase
MAKKKTRAEIQEDLKLLEVQYINLTEQHLELNEECARKRSYIAHLELKSEDLEKRRDNAQRKLEVFNEMNKQDRGRIHLLEDKITDFRKSIDEFEEDLEEQFNVLAVCVDNARAVITGNMIVK